MRKRITMEEAVRAVHDGKLVWRGNRAYCLKNPEFMILGDVKYIDYLNGDPSVCRRNIGAVGAIDWLLFRTLNNFEIEVEPEEPYRFGDFARWEKEHREAMNREGGAPSDWMTAGQALDWMAANPGQSLEYEENGDLWSIDEARGQLVVRSPGGSQTADPIPTHFYHYRFRIPPQDKKASP